MSATEIPALRPKSRSRLAAPTWQVQLPDDFKPAAYFAWKPPLDRMLAAALLIAGLPIIGLLALLVRLTSHGPAIYRQQRVGKNGRIFMIYKIRTMRHNAEARTGAVWTQADDARITRVGRILRTLHLDEFPQLFNVLRGEMALVGPRPERPEFVRVLTGSVPHYLHRLAVAPGITGLAQLNLPPDSDVDSVRRKLILDIEYIQHGSLFLDVRLCLCTFGRLFKVSEPWLTRLFRVQRTVGIPDRKAAKAGPGGGGPLPATPADIAAEETCGPSGSCARKTAGGRAQVDVRPCGDSKSHRRPREETRTAPKPR